MRTRVYRLGLVMAFVLAAFTAPAPASEVVRVGTYACPPFVIAEEGGRSGLAVTLWEGIAREFGIDYVVEDLDLVSTLERVAAGTLDVGLSCISITPEREESVDFSHAFYETHLAIAVRHDGWLQLLRNVFTDKGVLTALGIVFGLSCLVGGVFYALEHRSNDKIYSMRSRFGRIVEAIIVGLLFITKGPFNYYEFKTLLGRVLTVLIAAGSTLFIASLTAILASTFTLGQLQSRIQGPNDLDGARVGAKAGSTSAQFLRERNVTHRTYAEVPEMLQALDAGALDAVVADAPVLKYEIKRGREHGALQQVSLLPHVFEKQNYALVLPSDSPHEEAVNRALLRMRESPEWRQALIDYLGETP